MTFETDDFDSSIPCQSGKEYAPRSSENAFFSAHSLVFRQVFASTMRPCMTHTHIARPWQLTAPSASGRYPLSLPWACDMDCRRKHAHGQVPHCWASNQGRQCDWYELYHLSITYYPILVCTLLINYFTSVYIYDAYAWLNGLATLCIDKKLL